MNQILSTSNNNYNSNYNKNDTKKIIVFFCGALIILALIIVFIKVYGIYKKNKNEKIFATPVIVIEQLEDEVKISINCSDGLTFVEYIWNEEDAIKTNLNGSTTFEKIIEIPEGKNNALVVNTNSINNVNKSDKKVFTREGDTQKPVIVSFTAIDKQIVLTAEDNTGLAYITYNWDEEEEQTIELEENTITTEQRIDIIRGTHKLNVKVTDTSGNTEKITKLITGVNEPEIAVIRRGSKVNIKVTHDMGFKKIEFIINKKLYVYDANYAQYNSEQTTIEYDFPVEVGENIVKINAYSNEKLTAEDSEELDNYAKTEYRGKTTYVEQ